MALHPYGWTKSKTKTTLNLIAISGDLTKVNDCPTLRKTYLRYTSNYLIVLTRVRFTPLFRVPSVFSSAVFSAIKK